ncbi:restriction endonuclease [Streptomyces sp. NPDC057927]
MLAEGESQAAISNKRGHLFERFVARLLQAYGYEEPTAERLNVSADGIELDVRVTHRLTGQPAIAECKAYSSPVKAGMLGTFHSKLVVSRFTQPTTHGFFVALPRLTAQGLEQSQLISANDPGFTVLTAAGVVDALRDLKEITDCPVTDILASDPAVLVTEHGVYASCLQLNAVTRTPERLLVWGNNKTTPLPVLELASASPYAQGVAAVDARRNGQTPIQESPQEAPQFIVTVEGSTSDFEYQLPASPRFFVGRKKLLATLQEALGSASVVVLNAQSGWGKSSLALQLEHLTEARGGHALVVDTRTANSRRFVTDVLSRAALEAQERGILILPGDASWASLVSSLRTLRDSQWLGSIPLTVFFDQFENVFRDEALTREFRDLALGARELQGQILIGFAWKTDHVGWTESHPYRLRDEIRAGATVLTIGPMGASDIETLLRRLEKQLGSSLARDLRQRLREYSQGLPWLFKKLAGHLLREVAQGATQEQLASEALNVQNLFEADLAELGPKEQEALNYIARYAPISISEVEERVTGAVLETLLNRRLVVQVGERIDTYWDIFRDYLNTGSVPVEDSYIVRQTPRSVARLLREVVADGGDGNVPEIARRLSTSENALFNLSREIRLMGVTAYESNRVRILDHIWDAVDRESQLRRTITGSLRRHRAYSVFTGLAERMAAVTNVAYARELKATFPAIEVKDATWVSYGRAYLLWFEYAGLAVQRSQSWFVAPEGTDGVGQLLGGRLARKITGTFMHEPPGAVLRYAISLASGSDFSSGRRQRRSGRALVNLGAAIELEDGNIRLVRQDLVVNGEIDKAILSELLLESPGSAAAVRLIAARPAATPEEVGSAVKEALKADWNVSTAQTVGKHARGWAKAAGLRTEFPTRGRMGDQSLLT